MNKQQYCKDCGKKLDKYASSKNIVRCRKCADKQHGNKIRGKNNPNYKNGLSIQNITANVEIKFVNQIGITEVETVGLVK